MKQIPLTNNGEHVLVDDKDFDRVSAHRWFMKWFNNDKEHNVYPARSIREGKNVKTVLLHRFIVNAEHDVHVHHKNKNHFDCRCENLEILTPEEHYKTFKNIDDIPF